MKSYSVFLVSHKNLDSIKLIDAAFDSREKAEAYANRYKTHQEPDITEITVNPPYHSDQSQDCYYLEINIADNTVVECHISNTLESSNNALAGADNMEALSSQLICLTVIAPSTEGAIAKGLALVSK